MRSEPIATFMTFENIKVPANWTAEMDLAEFVDRYGESNNFFDEQMGRVFQEYDLLERVLDRALNYFGMVCQGLITAKLQALGLYLGLNAPSDAYRKRFAEDLTYCRHIVSEFARLVPDCDHNESIWLRHLIDLEDQLGAAADLLQESMCCEHDDFQRTN